MLEVDAIHTYYGDSHILHGASLRVGAGEAVALLGRNGVGKTTLIRSIVGFAPPREGAIRLAGTPIHRWPPYRIARAGVGLVPQGRRIFAPLTVTENLLLGARGPRPRATPRGPAKPGRARSQPGIVEGLPAQPDAPGKGHPRSELSTRPPVQWTAERVYDVFPRLRERGGQIGGTLSGGEQQMLAIGRALMTDPRLLLLDEPSEGLAPLVVREIGRVVARLKAERLSVLLVEQNVALALRVADRVYVMSKGRIVYHGTPAELSADEDVKRRFLGVS